MFDCYSTMIEVEESNDNMIMGIFADEDAESIN